MKKRFISLLTAAVMLLSAQPLHSDAADSLVLRAGSVTTAFKSGKTISVPVSADANPGYAAGMLDVCWDAEALRLTTVHFDTEKAPDNGSAAVVSDGCYRVSFGDPLATEDYTADGTFFTLVFKITDQARPADYAVTLEHASVYDKDIAAVPAVTYAGIVSLTGEPAAEDNAMILTAGNAEAACGESTELRIPVTASANPGYVSGVCDILWNADALTLKDVEYDDTLAPNNGSGEIVSDGSYRVAFGNYLAEKNYTETGTLFTLVFTVSKDAPAGDYTVIPANLNILDEDVKRVPAAAHAGTVTLKEPSDELTLGDVNGDGKISALDAQLTLQAYLDQMLGNPSELSDEQLKRADVNHDKKIAALDAQNILMYYLYNFILDQRTTWEELTG